LCPLPQGARARKAPPAHFGQTNLKIISAKRTQPSFWPNEPNVCHSGRSRESGDPGSLSGLHGSRLSLRSAGTTIGWRGGPTCGCTKRALVHLPCYRPVLYREPCNFNVSRRGLPHSLLTRCDRTDGRSWRSRRAAGRSRCCRARHSGRRRCCRCRAPPTTSIAARCCCRFARS
jgi:hypothetical protein